MKTSSNSDVTALFLSGSATLDAWPLMKTVQDSLENPQSHERPIVQVLCVTKLNLVITVCTGSTLKVREPAAGIECYQLSLIF